MDNYHDLSEGSYWNYKVDIKNVKSIMVWNYVFHTRWPKVRISLYPMLFQMNLRYVGI